MRKIGRLAYYLFGLCLLMAATAVVGQNESVTVYQDKDTIAVGELITITYIVSKDQALFGLPKRGTMSLVGYREVKSEASNQGDENEMTHILIYQATTSGAHTIAAAHIHDGTERLTSSEVQVEVIDRADVEWSVLPPLERRQVSSNYKKVTQL